MVGDGEIKEVLFDSTIPIVVDPITKAADEALTTQILREMAGSVFVKPASVLLDACRGQSRADRKITIWKMCPELQPPPPGCTRKES